MRDAKNKRVALFIGRFQPFHIGHLSALKFIDSEPDIDEIIIALGSINEINTALNPFNVSERKMMIESSLILKKPLVFVELPDFIENAEWTEFVVTKLPQFHVVYTRNELVNQLLSEAGFIVKEFPFLKNVSGTKVRKLIKNKREWVKYVPPETADVLVKVNGTIRIQGIKND